MATINASNRIAASAFNGESVDIVLNSAESLSVLPVLVLGQSCVAETSSATGIIDFIDTRNHRFRVKPKMPNSAFCSNKTNTLNALELITVTL